MKMRVLASLFVSFLLIAGQALAASEVPPTFADMVERLSPAVVNISSEHKIKASPRMMAPEIPGMPGMPGDPFSELLEQFRRERGMPLERQVQSLGSGFIIDPAGYVVTNNHVIDGADEIKVVLSDNTQLKAKLIGRDPKTDIALLKVEASKPLPFVSFGDSEKTRVGDWVICIGNPFGLGGTVTAGIISARARNIHAGPFDDFLQTDAAINRGNSGGPMFNADGEVIGINTAIFSPTGGSIGIGFAVPSSLAQPVIKQIKEFGAPQRGWLGVKIQDVSDEIADSVGLKETRGALVLEVSKGSPAAKAGIEAGDVILSFDGKGVTAVRTLPRIVADTKIGKSVEVVLWRAGKEKTVSVAVGELKEADESKEASAKQPKGKAPATKSEMVLGMSLVELSASLREQYGIEEEVEGLLVADLAPDSDAAQRGIRPGDIISQVNDASVTNVAGLKAVLGAAKKAGRKFVLLRVIREGDMAFITVPVK